MRILLQARARSLLVRLPRQFQPNSLDLFGLPGLKNGLSCPSHRLASGLSPSGNQTASRLVFFGSSPLGKTPVVRSLGSYSRSTRPYSTWIPGASSRDHLSLLSIFAVGLGLGFSVFYAIGPRRAKSERNSSPAEDSVEVLVDMSAVGPGRPGNLTPEQEEKLRRLWHLVFHVGGVDLGVEDTDAADTETHSSTTTDAKKPKKKRISLFSRKSKKEAEAEAEAEASPATPSKLITLKESDEDKYGQTKHFYDTLSSQTPEAIRSTIWSMVKHDNPDALLLRYLRARKWDVEKALVMLVSTMNWRLSEMHVDDDIMARGEGGALEDEASSDAGTKKLGEDFLAQIRMGKSYVHGVDKEGRPICVVRVRLHKQGEQAEASLERYTVYLIETCRFLLRPPVDTATIIFDMTGFSMANMDYSPVKFMIKCFEANYPESLGAVLVHKAPWIFQGIWKIIKGWLDPVVAGKVHFTNNLKELDQYIPPNQVLKELEGKEDWEYKFVEPIPGENDKMKDTETRDRLLAARELLVKEYEQATVQWIQNPEGDAATEIKAKRNALAAQLRTDYFVLDPYIRARSWYDRTGVLQPGGTLEFYAQPQLSEKPNGTAVAPVPETSADDVD